MKKYENFSMEILFLNGEDVIRTSAVSEEDSDRDNIIDMPDLPELK